MTALLTSRTELQALLAAADKAKKFVKVPREALQHLIMDHHKMYGLCKTQVVEPIELG